jgi:hypothetical protein
MRMMAMCFLRPGVLRLWAFFDAAFGEFFVLSAMRERTTL